MPLIIFSWPLSLRFPFLNPELGEHGEQLIFVEYCSARVVYLHWPTGLLWLSISTSGRFANGQFFGVLKFWASKFGCKFHGYGVLRVLLGGTGVAPCQQLVVFMGFWTA